MRKRYYYFFIILALIFATLPISTKASATDCLDVKIVFARGSGGERWKDQNYLTFKSSIETKLQTTSIKYEFIDLDYPAIGVGIDNLGVTAGAFFGGGEAYEFGDSIKTGTKNLKKLVGDTTCRDTKYVLGGYSQGAMVISRTLDELNPDKIIYATTFGDPKLYLPEGVGLIPAACYGENLSDYRMYVPDCQAYKGLLGAYVPYRPENFVGKVGTWCNKRDIFCSSHFSISDHTSYVSENLYEDASRVIFDKITKALGVENHISSPHDTAILIDSTGSMRDLIDKYKSEALRLAKQTLESGGRVALYDYRDLDDPYEAVQHCDFETCTMEVFEEELNKIVTHAGGDDAESLLSSAFKAMTDLRWKQGSTKSLVVLTDANFLSPDRDGMTFDEVVRLSKEIDPVNFYIITNEDQAENYRELARATDGLVVTDFDKLNLLTDYILDRYDSLPRVEEIRPDEIPVVLPETKLLGTEWLNETSVRIEFSTTGEQNMVILNDLVLGITDDNNIILNNLRRDEENVVLLVPIYKDSRGNGAEVILSAREIKAPNTGRL